jgi:hypothetical protein
MEVILKKSKITSSIISQTTYCSLSELNKFNVIGFCFNKENKYIVFYRSDTKELRKFVSFKSASYKKEYEKHIITVCLGGNYVDKNYQFDSEDEAIKILSNLKKALHESVVLGQFFI